jgi:SPP1 gp7 family putative phage head morphogenesis protein
VIPDGQIIEQSWNDQIFYPLDLEFEFQPDQLDIMQEDEADRATSLGALTNAGIPLILAMEILGYDLTDEQWAALNAAEEEKKRRAEELAQQFQGTGADVNASDAASAAGKPKPTADGVTDERGKASKALLDDLRRWAVKTKKRGKPCEFDSEHISPTVRALIADRFANDWESTFDFLKTRPDNAEEKERRLQKAIAVVLAAALLVIVAHIEAGEDPELETLHANLRAAIEPILVAICIEAALRAVIETGVGLDVALLNAAALEWAHTYSYELIQGLTETTRQVVSNAITSFIGTPGMTHQALVDMLAPTFGAVRAESISITEVTRAFSAAINIQQQELAKQGILMDRFWLTANDERVCPTCGKLHGMHERVWKHEFPAGPPAHPWCRCDEELRLRKP